MMFYTKFSPKPSIGLEFTDPSMTEQHFKDECDINNIVARFSETGVLPQGNRQPLFGDFEHFPTDLAASMAMYDEAHARFMELDASIRKQFDNDPAQLLAFLNDPNNREEAIQLGLIDRSSPAESPVPSQETIVETSPEIEAEN